jgi:hypothetical protein
MEWCSMMNDGLEALKISLEESKRQTKERKNKGKNMIRPFTFEEEKILRDGLKEKIDG